MLLKAAILHKGGGIRERGAKETIGFDACVRKGLSDGAIKFLTNEQALLLQTINGFRDAAQHHLLDVSEGLLYMHAQGGVTLFRDLCSAVFNSDLLTLLPIRVLPVSTSPPTTLAALFESEIAAIRKLLSPGKRRKLDAEARLRPLAILNATIVGQKGQPSSGELLSIASEIVSGHDWQDIFRGAASIEIASSGSGPSISFRVTKKEGIPIQLVPEGTPGASVVAVKRVDELGFYSLGAKELASKCGASVPSVIATVDYLGIRKDIESYKEIRIGKSVFKRYSPLAISKITECLKSTDLSVIRAKNKKNNAS